MEADTIQQTNAELAAVIAELREYEKKNLLINRIRLWILSGCLVLGIAMLIFVFCYMGGFMQRADTAVEVLTEAGNNINTLAEDLEKMDFENLGKSLSNIVSVSEVTIGEIHQAAGGLDSLIRDADEAMQHINSVNYEELNNGIKRLNDVLEPLAKFFNIFH